MRSRALVMRKTGAPEVLAREDVELAPLRAGELRVRALASAVNHSDLEIRAGNWAIRREPRFPYVPGLEVVGEWRRSRPTCTVSASANASGGRRARSRMRLADAARAHDLLARRELEGRVVLVPGA